jgi:hypothetical protein
MGVRETPSRLVSGAFRNAFSSFELAFQDQFAQSKHGSLDL